MLSQCAFPESCAIFIRRRRNVQRNILLQFHPCLLYTSGIGELLSEADGTASVQRELTPEDFDARDVKLGFYRKLDRFSQMQVLSGVDALRDAGFTIDADNASRVGSTIGTADGPMAEITSFQKTVCEKMCIRDRRSRMF